MPTSDAVAALCCRLVAQDLHHPSAWADAAIYCRDAARTAQTPQDTDDLLALADYYAAGCVERPTFGAAWTPGNAVRDPITGALFT